MSVSPRYNPKRALQERSGLVFLIDCLSLLPETNMLINRDTDILQKTIVAEEAIVRKAGGKYKMLPLFTETTTKIKTVRDKYFSLPRNRSIHIHRLTPG